MSEPTGSVFRGPPAGATDSLPEKGRGTRTTGSVGKWPQARTNSGCGFCFRPSAEGFFLSIENKKENSRDEERLDSKGKKMQMGFCAVAKYALHSDANSPVPIVIGTGNPNYK